MADINFGNPQEEVQESFQTKSPIVEPLPIEPENVNSGLTMEEINDANKISVEIADKESPLVILFGPPSCGKTMTLVRLTRYLQSKGYTVVPETSFRPTYDKNYKDMCDNFSTMINSEDAAKSTSKISFMLVKVLFRGRTLCQILEGPGEYYFRPESPLDQFPRYVNKIINSSNRKIWAIMLEPDKTNKRMTSEARKNYVEKIRKLKTKIQTKDKVMFIFNKIDETHFVLGPGQIQHGLALKEAGNLYPNIFDPFKNNNPISKWWQPYRFDFVAFQTGDFSKAADGSFTFEEGHEIYPKRLWSFIQKRIRG